MPYLTFNDGITREFSPNALGLLRITLPDGTSLIPTEHDAYPDSIVDTSKAESPIIIESTDTFENIKTYVPFPADGNDNYPKIDFDQLVVAPYNYWQDDDGDELVPSNLSEIKGALQVTWKDNHGRDISSKVKSNPKTKPSPCDAPYSLTVELKKGVIKTKYGKPSQLTIDDNSHVYYFYPKVEEPIFCYAQPNLTFGDGQYAGPAEQWDPMNGFKLQNINNPQSNFPTVGSNNLFFKLIVDGITAAEIISSNGSIIQPESGEGVTLELTPENNQPQGKVVRVTLHGLTDSAPNGSFSPSTFKIFANKNGNNKLLYNFTINRWFIAHLSSSSWNGASRYCPNLASSPKWRVPDSADYSNGTGYATRKIAWDNTNQSRNKMGGLMNEWGNLYTDYYAGSEWEGDSHHTGVWATEYTGGAGNYSSHNAANRDNGRIDWHYDWDWYGGKIAVACVTP
ncbi:hypothetical protein [Gilliamella sp. wkB112]|uniref:hypothetical protein n=1 Tax=Gilliamella sp. wkB112 TaxID=3120257 RepID=UPI001146C389|nr:hypothetical protein [Gilliamella apicola]